MNVIRSVIEQAGGMAIDGTGRIMEIQPETIHQRTPIFIGSKQNVLKVKEFLEEYANESVKV